MRQLDVKWMQGRKYPPSVITFINIHFDYIFTIHLLLRLPAGDTPPVPSLNSDMSNLVVRVNCSFIFRFLLVEFMEKLNMMDQSEEIEKDLGYIEGCPIPGESGK